ncbi:MAG: family 16 glycoside hydrolase [Nitrososphaeraceae archaeon]
MHCNAIGWKPVGQWNTFEIEVKGQKYSVTLNGEKVNQNSQTIGILKDILEFKIMMQTHMFHLRISE